MNGNYKLNSALYKQNRRPRQLRGYLAFGGMDRLMEKIASPPLDEHGRRLFSTLIPADMRGQAETILFADGIFAVYTERPHWANWVRNRSQRLTDSLLAGGVRIRELRVVMCPARGAGAPRPVDKPVAPPREAPALLRQRAADAASGELKSALERLADGIESRGGKR